MTTITINDPNPFVSDGLDLLRGTVDHANCPERAAEVATLESYSGLDLSSPVTLVATGYDVHTDRCRRRLQVTVAAATVPKWAHDPHMTCPTCYDDDVTRTEVYLANRVPRPWVRALRAASSPITDEATLERAISNALAYLSTTTGQFLKAPRPAYAETCYRILTDVLRAAVGPGGPPPTRWWAVRQNSTWGRHRTTWDMAGRVSVLPAHDPHAPAAFDLVGIVGTREDDADGGDYATRLGDRNHIEAVEVGAGYRLSDAVLAHALMASASVTWTDAVSVAPAVA